MHHRTKSTLKHFDQSIKKTQKIGSKMIELLSMIHIYIYIHTHIYIYLKYLPLN